MIPLATAATSARGTFGVSPKIVWLSALFMGVLGSLPKILESNITAVELLYDSATAFVFSIFVWQFNLMALPKQAASQGSTAPFFSKKLLISLLAGCAVMVLPVLLHQYFFPHYRLASILLMYQFRGTLINLTIYLFLFVLYQNYRAQITGVELERVKADHVSARFELLKQQVNPHFLFNSLNTLKSMVETGDAHSVDFILKLSDFYRFSLASRKQDVTPLATELEVLDAYAYLLKARFEDGFVLHINLPPAIMQAGIPPFTLQLLMENCIKHNIISLEQPLAISIYTQGQMLVVSNARQPKLHTEASTGMGLDNISERYVHLCGQPIVVEQSSTHFTVKLPLIYAGTNY